MLRNIFIIGIGWLFAIGLGISGMTDVNAVIGFLNVAGDWDPSLLGVMGGAIAVYALALPLIRKFRDGPLHGKAFHIPTRKDIDMRLVGGAALFGAGWGISGICPGPGITSAVAGAETSLAFVAAMVLGIAVYHRTLSPCATPKLAVAKWLPPRRS